MLPFHAHYRRKHSPFRERREIRFSVGAPPAPGDPDDPDNPDDEGDTPPPPENDPTRTVSQNTNDISEETYRQMFQTVTTSTQDVRDDTPAANRQVSESNELSERIDQEHNAEREAETKRLAAAEEEKQRKAREEAEEEMRIKEAGLLKDIAKTREEVSKVYQAMGTALPQAQQLAEMNGAEGVEALAQFERNHQELNALNVKMGAWENIVKRVAEWKKGDVSPVHLRMEIADTAMELRMGDGRSYVVQALDRLIDEYGGEDDPRNLQSLKAMNKSDSKRFLDAIHPQLLLDNIHLMNQEVNAVLKDMKTITTVIQEEYKEFGGRSNDGLSVKIQWFTINDLIQGGKNVFQAYKDRWKRGDKRRQAVTSMWFGKMFSFLPGSDEVQHLLRQTLEGEDRKATKDFIEYLQSNRVALVDIVGTDGHSGLLKQTKHNPALFMAVLEYTAAQGWLYDFDLDTGKTFGHALEIGKTLPSFWTPAEKENYIDSLNSKYLKGQAEQRDEGKKRGKKILSDAQAMRAFEKQVEEMNYWGAIGVVEGMWEKAKNGHSSALATVMFLNGMRGTDQKSRLFRKYFPLEALDQTSFAIQAPAYLPTMLKFQKGSIREWQMATKDIDDWTKLAETNKAAMFQEAGNLAKTMTMIEAEIHAAQERAGKPRDILNGNLSMTEAVAKVLAGHTLKAKDFGWDKSINIFDKQYKDFRDTLPANQSNMDPTKADPSYYKPGDGGSEAIMMKLETYFKLLSAVETGRFKYDDLAWQMLEQILMREEEIKEHMGKDSQAYHEFIEEVGGKMTKVFIQSFNNDKSETLADRPNESKAGQMVLMEFFKRGIVDPDALMKMLGQQNSAPLAIKLLRQLHWTQEDLVKFLVKEDEDAASQEQRKTKKEDVLVLGPGEKMKALEALLKSGQPFSKDQLRYIADRLQEKNILTAEDIAGVFGQTTGTQAYNGGPGTGAINTTQLRGGQSPGTGTISTSNITGNEQTPPATPRQPRGPQTPPPPPTNPANP